MYRLIPIAVIAFILTGAFLCSCDSNPPIILYDSCDVPGDTCDTTLPCDTCDTTKGDPDSLSHAFTWTEYSIPEEAYFTGAWVFNDNLIYVMGNKLWRWNGTVWEREKVFIYQTQREAAFADGTMFALSPTDMWFINGWVYHYYDGSADELAALAPGVRSCWGKTSNDMFFVGDSGTIQHYDGEKFTKFPQVTTKPLYDVSGTSHNDVWATGFNFETDESVLLHFDGTSWKEDEFSSSGKARQYGIGSVWCTDSAGHRIATITGTRVWRKTDDGPWRMDTSEIGNSLGGGSYVALGIRGDNANNMIVAGPWGMVSHWNGKTWHKFKELYNYDHPSYFTQGLSIKGNTICIAGKKNGSWIAIGRRKP